MAEREQTITSGYKPLKLLLLVILLSYIDLIDGREVCCFMCTMADATKYVVDDVYICIVLFSENKNYTRYLVYTINILIYTLYIQKGN